MRSRYSAYALGKVRYIIDTTHKNNPLFKKKEKQIVEELERFALETQYTGLEILEFIDGTDEAFVTFFAHLQQGDRDLSFKEKSRFLKVNQKWLYESGSMVEH
jgi:SEC-C motif-containing protein